MSGHIIRTRKSVNSDSGNESGRVLGSDQEQTEAVFSVPTLSVSGGAVSAWGSFCAIALLSVTFDNRLISSH